MIEPQFSNMAEGPSYLKRTFIRSNILECSGSSVCNCSTKAIPSTKVERPPDTLFSKQCKN